MTRALSRRVIRHYRGFATGQLRELEANPSVKKLLYVLRTTLTGAHLLRTGDVVTDVTRLLGAYGFSRAQELVEAKRAGEEVPLSQETLEGFRGDLDRAFATLDESENRSPLPVEPANRGELQGWLLALRRARV